MSRLRMVVTGVLLVAGALLLSGKAQATPLQAEVGVSLDIGYFYDQLSPYGQWVDDPTYG